MLKVIASDSICADELETGESTLGTCVINDVLDCINKKHEGVCSKKETLLLNQPKSDSIWTNRLCPAKRFGAMLAIAGRSWARH